MARFATSEKARKVSKLPDTRNRAGAAAYKQSDKVQLASILLTSFVQDQFYRSASGTMNELVALIRKVDPIFAAKAAVYARNEFHMRSVTHIVGGEIPAIVKGEKWTKHFLNKVIERPDDATEILAYYLSTYGKPVPNSLKKGLALGLSKFDAYQLGKYRGDKNAVSLVDILNLTHVKPNEKNAKAFEALVDGELRAEKTTEAVLSKAGSSSEGKTAAWDELILEGKIGYMALVKNLRNIEQNASKEAYAKALETLVDPNRVHRSKLLPFRFASAVREVNKRDTIRALNTALDIACDNVTKLSGRTLIAVDHSGSMGTGSTANSRRSIADLFAAIMFKSNDADVAVFGDDARIITGLNPDDSTLTVMGQINSVCRGHSTNFPDVYRVAVDSGEKYDRVITVSDMQSWVTGGWGYANPETARKTYEKKRGVKVHSYNLDLAGYGTSMGAPGPRTYEFAGFSEKVFDIMALLETDKDAMVHAIEAVQL